MRTILMTTMLGMALLAAAPHADAFGMRGGAPFMRGRGGPGGPGGPPLRLLLAQLTPAQRAQVRQTLLADRGEMRDILQQLRQAHEALGDKMFAAGTLTEKDVEPQIQKIATLHQQLLEHGLKVMLQVRSVATPEQLAKAAQAKQQLDQLHKQMQALLGDESADDDVPEDPAQ